MTSSTLLSPDASEYQSLRKVASEAVPGVHFWIRRISLGQRIELTRRVRELTLRNEFLAAGNESQRIEAALADLMAMRLYLEWGLERIEDLTIDGEPASVEAVIDRGPEALCNEIAAAIQEACGFLPEERKNS